MSITVASHRAAPAESPSAGACPRVAPGVELLGPYQDSGLENPPYLLCRAGRMVQVSRLLHVVAATADGTRGFEEMAAVASVALERALTGEQVRVLVETKLVPTGIVIVDGAAVPPPLAPAPERRLLALRFRTALLSPHAVDVGARFLAPLFRAPVVAGVLAGVVGLDVWLFGVHGVGAAVDQVVAAPMLMVFVLGLTVLSATFHEFGHAAACRYSGARPGAAGAGLYLWWPVFFTNVTDAYRLDRRGRLRTDLGGVYFNAVFVVALGWAYAATGYEPLLAVVVLQHVLVVHQFTPWLRTDGYYILSDLTGVPDILNRVRPALQSLIPRRPTHPDVAALRPRARRILFIYLASLALFLVLGLVPAVLRGPAMLAANWSAVLPRLHGLREAAGQWDTVLVVARAVQIAFLALPGVGLVLTVGLIATRVAQGAGRLVLGAGRTVRSALRGVGHDRHRLRAPGPAASPETTIERREIRVRRWLEHTGLAIVDGSDVPGGGAVDYFGFGLGGELFLLGTALGRPAPEVAAKLLAAAGTLGSLCSDELDRLLLDGPPFAEAVARAARRVGCDWDERRFRAQLDDTLARHEFKLIVLCGSQEPGVAEFMEQLGLGCRNAQLGAVAI